MALHSLDRYSFEFGLFKLCGVVIEYPDRYSSTLAPSTAECHLPEELLDRRPVLGRRPALARFLFMQSHFVCLRHDTTSFKK